MEIKLLKNYKKHLAGSCIRINKLNALMLIKRGVAEEVLNSFDINNLIVAELVTILRKRNGKDKDTEHNSYRIFLKRTKNSYFQHAISGKKYLPSFFNLMDKLNVGEKAVNSYSIVDFKEYFKDQINSNQIGNNSMVQKQELEKLEEELNSNVNHVL